MELSRRQVAKYDAFQNSSQFDAGGLGLMAGHDLADPEILERVFRATNDLGGNR
jgi:hypothetical protein